MSESDTTHQTQNKMMEQRNTIRADIGGIQNNYDNSHNCQSVIKSMCTCMGILVGGASLMGIIGGYVAWPILSIIALANKSNDDIKDICPNSNIWVCLLILVVIGVLSIVGGSKSGEKKEGTIVVILMFNIAFIIWVGLEVHKQCAVDNLSDMTIYMYLSAWFWFAISIFGLVIVGLCGAGLMAGGIKDILGKRSKSEVKGGSPCDAVLDNEMIEISRREYNLFKGVMDYIKVQHVIVGRADDRV